MPIRKAGKRPEKLKFYIYGKNKNMKKKIEQFLSILFLTTLATGLMALIKTFIGLTFK